MARIDSMGINISGIETAIRILNVKDPLECIGKVRELLSKINSFEEKHRKEKGMKEDK